MQFGIGGAVQIQRIDLLEGQLAMPGFPAGIPIPVVAEAERRGAEMQMLRIYPYLIQRCPIVARVDQHAAIAVSCLVDMYKYAEAAGQMADPVAAGFLCQCCGRCEAKQKNGRYQSLHGYPL